MTAELVIKLPDGGTRRVALEEINTIGRHPDSKIPVDDEVVSRNHALVRCEDDEYYIIDLGSSNGTFVNGQPIAVPTLLRKGDQIRVGTTHIEFQSDVATAEYDFEEPPRQATRRVFMSSTMAVLVSDVRNFTPLSETIPGQEMSSIISQWYRAAGHCIDTHKGTIEQFRGDSVMAYWLADPFAADPTHYVKNALHAARDMVVASAPFNDLIHASYPELQFQIGCGLHVGDAVLGNVGSDARRDFTTMGDCINTAFRIESMCSALDRQILVSEIIKSNAGDDFAFSDLGRHSLKGKSEQMQIYALEAKPAE